MSKVLSILILLAILAGVFFVVKYSKDSYELLPVNNQEPMKEWNQEVENNFHDWHEFSSPTGQFKVLLPGLPQHATDIYGKRKYDIYATTDDNGRAFMISTITFPETVNPKQEEDALKDAVNDMMSRSKENKLKMMQMGKLREFRALDFGLENKDVAVGGKAFLFGKTLYILSMIDKTGKFNENVLNFFVNSFIPEEPKSAQESKSEKATPTETPVPSNQSTNSIPKAQNQ